LGGIRQPSVPTEQPIPVTVFIITEAVHLRTATLANVADVALDDPQIALNAVAPATVAIATPPGNVTHEFVRSII